MSPPSRRLRVLMTTDAVGGVWVFATALARELCRGGDRVTLVTLGPPPQRHQLAAVRDIDGLDIEVTDLALEWLDPEGRDLPRALVELTAIEQRVAPDIVHLNSFREACADWSAPVLVTAHSCVRSWWRACRGGQPDEPRWQKYSTDVSAGLKRADAWTAPTRAFRDDMKALYAPPRSGQVILNGSDGPAASTAKEPFILAAGRLWDEAKNLSALTGIAAELDWPIRLAGPLRPVDGTTGQDLGLGTMEWLGELARPDLLAQMRRAAIFVSPAMYEPFGLTVLEAAAAGCALVLSGVPTFRELWAGAALMVDPLNNRAIGAALQRLCNDAPLRLALQQAAAERARRYSLAAMVDGYRDAYANLAAGVPAARGASAVSTAEARP